MAGKRVRIIPLGGIREIGKNATAVEYGGQIVLVDAGVRFPEEELRGIELLVPDVTYVQERRDRLQALLLTHGHEGSHRRRALHPAPLGPRWAAADLQWPRPSTPCSSEAPA